MSRLKELSAIEARRLDLKRPWTARFVAAALIGFLVLMILGAPDVLSRVGQPGIRDGLIRAEGYTRLINDLVIARGWLEMNCASERVCEVVDSAYAPKDDEDWENFKNRTYLARDMRDPARWRVFATDNQPKVGKLEIMEIDPLAHQVASPYTRSPIWAGDLLYRGEPRSVLIQSAERGEPVGETYHPFAIGGASEIQVFQAPSGAELTRGAGRYVFKSGECLLAQVMLVGEGPALVRVPPKSNVPVCLDTEITVSGTTVTASGNVQFASLGYGEILVFRRGQDERRFIYAADTRIPISRVSASASGTRITVPSLVAFSRGVERLMINEPKHRPLQTTLDQGLHHLAQDTLNQALPSEQDLRAAITIMDAKTGEVLALASRPQTTLALPYQLDEEFQYNQNFVALPIGSAAKVPLAIAILQEYPQLTEMRLQPTGFFTTVMGVDLGTRGINDTVKTSEPIGLAEALGRSSNKFAVGLMLQGLLGPFPHDEGFGGKPPALITDAGGVINRNFQSDAGKAIQWRGQLSTLFDLCYEYVVSCPGGDEDYLWGLSTKDWQLSRSGIYPEHENLGLNHIPDLYTDYLMSVLGGSRSRWTAIKTAEIYSRVVTRLAVRARLVSGFPLPEAMKIENPEAWNAVVDGMLWAADPLKAGTAIFLGKTIASNSRYKEKAGLYRIFAKTGTPDTVEIESLNEGQIAVMNTVLALARRRCQLIWDDRNERMVLPEEKMREVCQDLIGDDTGRRNAINAELAELSPRHLGKSKGSPRYLDTEIVSQAMSYRMSKHQGHVIVVVAARYDEDPGHDRLPKRALTVVVNLQDSHNRAINATELASKILIDPAVTDWLEKKE
jgi:hypothetical protein